MHLILAAVTEVKKTISTR